jgi:hypothetical protein
MLRENCRVGMKVYFGRRNGEKTHAKVTKMNGKTAKCETLEERGYNRPAGQEWNVPYSLMTPVDSSVTPTVPSMPVSESVPEAPILVYNQFDEDNLILEAIFGVYNDLSPENLSCDGELPMSQINARRTRLNRKLRGLCMAMGRDISEDEIYQWWQDKESKQRNVTVPSNTNGNNN